MIIRKASLKDIDELTGLYLRYNEELEKIVLKKNLFFREKKKDYKNQVRNAINIAIEDRHSVILVAEENKLLIGTISGSTDRISNDLFKDKLNFGYLQYLYLLPEFRKRGFSSKLKDELIKWFKFKNCDYVRLEVSLTNPSINSYEKWGFRTDSVKMVLNLNDKKNIHLVDKRKTRKVWNTNGDRFIP